MLPRVIYNHSSIFSSKAFNIIIILKFREYSKIPLGLVIKIPKQYDDYILGLQNQRYEICY